MSRNFQTSDKKDNNKDFLNFKNQDYNHNHVTSVSMVSQKSKRVLNKYVLLDKSFKWFCFALKSPFLLVAYNDSFSLEFM